MGAPTLIFWDVDLIPSLIIHISSLRTKVGQIQPHDDIYYFEHKHMWYVISGFFFFFFFWDAESISAILRWFRVMVATQSRVKAVCLKISISKYNHVTYLFIGFWGRWTHFWHLYGYLADVGRPSTWSLSLTWPNSTTRRGIIIFHVYSFALPSCRASPWCQVSPMEFHLLWLELALSL